MFIAILGRQPALGATELERLYGGDRTRWFSDRAMLIESDAFDFNRLGGSLKAGRIILQTNGNWQMISRTVVDRYAKQWYGIPHKITLGISAYGFRISSRDVQKTGLLLKKQLQQCSVSLRLIPNTEPALNTAASHHNKLGLSPHKIELLIVRNTSGRVIIAESIGAQNISALAARDQVRPRTDAFVGMLPPKLARMMVNFTGLPEEFDSSAAESTSRLCILDPLCGTGTVLQEALLNGYSVVGTDLSQKMIDYTTENLAWLRQKFRTTGEVIALQQADATTFQWKPPRAINAVVCETYLGQPFSAPPRLEKLHEVAGNCNHIITTFLRNIHSQLGDAAPLVLAVPAWRDHSGHFTHLPLIKHLADFGYQRIPLHHIHPEQLLYYRENQVVAREILILTKSPSTKSMRY